MGILKDAFRTWLSQPVPRKRRSDSHRHVCCDYSFVLVDTFSSACLAIHYFLFCSSTHIDSLTKAR